MKSPEEMTDEELYAEIDKGNDSGISTADLVALIRSRHSPSPTGPMSGDEFMAYLDKLVSEAGTDAPAPEQPNDDA